MHSKPTQLLCRHLINYCADTRGVTNIIQDHLPLASKFKNLFRLGIPRIELGTLRSLSVHLTTRLNPQQCYICVSDKFQTKKTAIKFALPSEVWCSGKCSILSLGEKGPNGKSSEERSKCISRKQNYFIYIYHHSNYFITPMH